MEESEIIELFRSRNERAVEEAEKLFGRKLLSIAVRILGDPEDAKECVNETLWKAWSAMPAGGPEYLRAYLLKICRNEAINMLRYKNAEKRQGVILELTAEMEQSIPNRMEEAKIEARELEASINRFLTELPEEKRKIFMRRYWPKSTCILFGITSLPLSGWNILGMENRVVEPHSSSDVLIDLSKAYDLSRIGPLEQEKDWYYPVLTDDRFLFGHDWQCTVDFEGRAEESQKISGEWREPAPEPERPELSASSFRFENWHAPLDSMILSGVFGEQQNGLFSEEINLAGEGGESVYAVAASRVLETGFEARKGKYVILLLEDGTEVTYAHLKEIQVQEGETKEAGETIGTLGATGMATGPNLALKVCVDGEPMDPIRQGIPSGRRRR